MSKHEQFIESIAEFCEHGSGDAVVVCGNRRRVVQIGEAVAERVKPNVRSVSGYELMFGGGRRVWLTTPGRLRVVWNELPRRVFLDPAAAELNPEGARRAVELLVRNGMLPKEAADVP